MYYDLASSVYVVGSFIRMGNNSGVIEMNRFFAFLFFLLCLSSVSYASTSYYILSMPGYYSSREAACAAGMGNYAQLNGTPTVYADQLIGVYATYCSFTYKDSANPVISGNGSVSYVSISCPDDQGFKSRLGGQYGSCEVCSGDGSSLNTFTGMCQQNCDSHAILLDQYAEFTSACIGGCEVIAHADSNGFEGLYFGSYSGAFCGPDSPPPPFVPPVCASGAVLDDHGHCQCPDNKEVFAGSCVVPCGAGEIRNALGMCVPACESGAMIGGECVPTNCPDGQELQSGVCVDHPANPNCGAGEVSDANGMCVPACDSGAMIGGQCVPITCPDAQYLDHGKCVNRDSNCPYNTHWEIGCKSCVADGSPIGACTGTPGDSDGDGIPNSSDPDIDGDGIPNNLDSDSDGDGIPNATDTDDDNDGIPDISDPTPQGPGSTPPGGGTTDDSDGDGIPNSTDTDLDGDGTPNATDTDSDGDGIPNSTDTDDDNDGIPDGNDPTPQGPGSTNPDLKCVGPQCDTDGDGIPDGQDPDKDGNGIPDAEETERAGSPGSALGDLYEPKGVTLSDVWGGFKGRVSQSPIALSAVSFFSLGQVSSTCPIWTFPATSFTDSIQFDYFCRASIIQGLQVAGVIVLLVAAFFGFCIAVL